MNPISIYRTILMNLNKSLPEDVEDKYGLRSFRNGFLLRNGVIISIQASEFHYCEPRMLSRDYTIFNKVEVGLYCEIKNIPNYILSYNDDVKDEKDEIKNIKVFPFVPIEEVVQLVIDCGGIFETYKLFPSKLA